MKTEFERILREKIQHNHSEEINKSSSLSSDCDPLHLAFLLGTLERDTGLPRKNNSYFRAQLNLSRLRSMENTPLPTPPTPPAHLSVRQQEGWLWFWKRGAPLSENYTKGELQRQFRKLAKILHPDQNPHPKAAESFVTLRDHYDHLLN